MSKITKIETPATGLVGFLHEIEVDKDSILVFQLPRQTNMLSSSYIEGAMNSIKKILPNDKKAIVIGADVNIYSIAGEEATALILKGLI